MYNIAIMLYYAIVCRVKIRKRGRKHMSNKKKILSLAVAVSMITSAFTSFAAPVNSEDSLFDVFDNGITMFDEENAGDSTVATTVPTATTEVTEATTEPTATTEVAEATPVAITEAADSTPNPDGSVVYVDEDFESYDVGTVISMGKTEAPTPVTKGKITYAAGNRKDGANTTSSIVETEDEINKYFYVNSDGYSTSGRGISFTFTSDAGIPAVAELAANDVLELSMDVSSTTNFELTGFGSMPVVPAETFEVAGTGSEKTTVEKLSHARAIIDKANNKQYIIVTNSSGEVISSTVSDLTATGFTGATFYEANAKVKIDNLKVEKKAADTGIVNVTVKDKDGKPVADTTLTIGKTKYTTDANGVATIALPNGEYTVVATKSGYEHTSGQADNDTQKVTVNSDTQNVEMSMSLMTYVKIPDTVEIGGGQDFIAAPKDATPTTTSAFTAKVIDQFGIEMTSDEYELKWSIYPHGSTEADANVTIDENGVVSVAQGFTPSDENANVAAYDVTVAAFTDDRNNKVTKTLYIGKNDVSYYEDVNWIQGGGTGNRGGNVNLKNAVELPDISSVTTTVNFPTGTDGQTTLLLSADGGNLVGIQYTSDGTIKAWTGWSGNSAFNQSSDAGAFANSGVLVENYTKGTELTFTFVIDKTNKSITASCGANTVALPFTVTANKLTGFKFGQYRSYGAVTVKNITVQEPDNNYLAVIGSEEFAKISGKTVEKTYALGQSVIVPDEEFTWAVTKKDDTTTSKTTNSTKVVVTPKTSADSAELIKVVYDDDNTVKSVQRETVNNVQANVGIEVDVTPGTKVMLWDSLEGMKPLADVAVAQSGGVTIDQNGKLSVTDEAVAGEYNITATSKTNTSKTATLTVKIGDFQTIAKDKIEVSGPISYNLGTDTTGTYSITKAVDSFGDEVSALLPAAKWTSSNADVATITEDGTLTVVGKGTTNVVATITNGTAVTTVTVPVTVDTYYVSATATGNETTVDTSSLIQSDKITGYQVTTAKDGAVVKQEVVTTAPTTVDTTDADSVEIAPVFVYDVQSPGTLGNLGAGYDIPIPAGTYNFNVKVGGSRCDVYVNKQMLVNNILQGGSTPDNLDVHDIVVNDGIAKITTADYANGQSETGSTVVVKVVKVPSNVTREKKMYVLGDSLVCIYYNGGSDTNNTAQTGWGQVLQNYVKDYEIVNLANSGVTANGLYGTAFTQVLESAKSGDVMILESGYNDRTYDTTEVMINAVTQMYNQATAKGIDVILVSPNASDHDYKADVANTSVMAKCATDLNAKYIDLAKLSYDFLYGTYGTNSDAVKATYNVSDRLHSQYKGAQKWASIVAGKLIDFGYGDSINTEYKYEFTDSLGNTITCQAAATPDSATYSTTAE